MRDRRDLVPVPDLLVVVLKLAGLPSNDESSPIHHRTLWGS